MKYYRGKAFENMIAADIERSIWSDRETPEARDLRLACEELNQEFPAGQVDPDMIESGRPF